MASFTTTSELWDTLAGEAAAESPLWAESLRSPELREPVPVFSRLSDDAFALGVETIYEGYLLHYGRPRLFSPGDTDTALLLGDYLYAHGLVRIARTGEVGAVLDLAELISLCAQARADGRPGEAEAWAATAACLGSGQLADARQELRSRADPRPLAALARRVAGDDAVERAGAAHALRVG